MFSTAKRVPRASVQTAHVAAPLGGINTVDGGSAMPATDAVSVWNMIAAEYGLRSRLGYQEWVTGLGSEVRTLVPFSGSHKNGSTDKLFACTASGIWDVSASTTSPTRLIAFSVTSGDAGFGVSHVMATPAGRFVLYCDEENGYFVYTESNSTWTQVTATATTAWQVSHAYVVGDRVLNDSGKTYRCITAGTSAGAGGPTGTAADITDNTAHWAYVQAVVGNVAPTSLAFVTVWKNRVWLVEKDTSRAWYLGINAIFGDATSFDFGSKMRQGGPLSGLYNWSYDGGSGMDTSLVGISTAGDIVIYQGTDPASATTFGLKGCWYVGGVPAGRRIATDYGGDLLVMSLIGVLPLSKLVIGNPVVDRSQYATAKIANLFNKLASSYRTLAGWSLHIHPTDNALLLCVPTATSQPTAQLAMAFSTRGWSRYRDLPMYSAGTWNGQMYFGTVDGRVCVNTGYVDGVLLSDANAYTPVRWSFLTAFNNLGNARMKRLAMLLPSIRSETQGPSVQCAARFDFDFSELAAPAGTGIAAKGTWDNALWDTAVWGGDATPSNTLGGTSGMGRHVAVAMAGSAISETTVVGCDVYFDVGGSL